ncbi:protein of unknown function [Nitrospira japonica]|uniref:AlgX/AlgJ SGNH hydrolase-like domain-containing protein n=1 Tax=Nitrospira japonica TaxID=1325564 RepID=A0A1W1I810_9BACT|nr:hypothetical protein [Nitrospira japonica]SLM49147.1 protein of unknown function [Nitrospira japonica]
MPFAILKHARLLLLGAILVVFFLPLILLIVFAAFHKSSASDLGSDRLELSGVVKARPEPAVSFSNWLDHTLQGHFDDQFSKVYGGRALFVRLGNQIYYSLFDKSYMQDQSIIVGKHHQLYERWYIEDYCKIRRPMRRETVAARARQIRELQSELQNRGIPLIVLITPNKASIYPEDIPEGFCGFPKFSFRDYDSFMSEFAAQHIQYVDGRAVTLAARAAAAVPLFCQGGTHWNGLGAYYTARQLTERIGKLTQTSVGPLFLQRLTVDHSPREIDRDLAALLNLAVPPYDYPAPHVMVEQRPAAGQLGKAVFVGGSFNWTLLDLLNKAKVFREIDFYYYYKLALETFPVRTSKPVDRATIDWQKDVLNARVLILEINESNFHSEYITAFLADLLQFFRKSPVA